MGDSKELKPPVLVIGGTRSGTTMMGNVLGSMPGMAYWHEPNTLWRIGHAYRAHDRATPGDVRPWIQRRIERAMLEFQRQHGGARIVEKSPYNPARLAYVHTLLPEAKIVHIYRDGRAMLRSQLEKLDTFRPFDLAKLGTFRYILRRLRMTPWWEWPAYLPRGTSALWRRHVLRQSTRWFGLHYEGWQDDLRAGMDRVQIVSKQWQHAIDYAFSDMKTVPDGSCLSVRYEDIASDPIHWLSRVCEFSGIEVDAEAIETAAKKIHESSVDRWKTELEPDVIARATGHMKPTLERLGYPLEIEPAPAGK